MGLPPTPLSTPQALQDFANWVASTRGDAVEAGTRPGEKVFEAFPQNHTPGSYRVFWSHGPAKSQITLVAITSHP